MVSSAEYVIGLDYGTNSCRAVLMQAGRPDELASASFSYPSGREGVILSPSDVHLARQNPEDYIAGFYHSVHEVIEIGKRVIACFDPLRVKGIGFATTGSTVIPVDHNLAPLSRLDRFSTNPNALAWLWKDHTSEVEAKHITKVLQQLDLERIARCGGQYSSEWFWAKILHLSRVDPKVYAAAHNFLELCEFLPLTFALPHHGIARSICALGHKALYVEEMGGLPSEDVLCAIDPALAGLRDRLGGRVQSADKPVGTLRPDVAATLGLGSHVLVAGGAFDAHVGAIGAGIEPDRLIKVMGTSTCDIMLAASDIRVDGVCGVFGNSVLPGHWGIEAGQSAVGDLFKWFVQTSVPHFYGADDEQKFERLTQEAAALPPGRSGLMALDWHNGNRTVLVDMDLNGLIIGQTLQTTAGETLRALMEATAFGALTIINRLEASGVQVLDIVCCGGLARKNALLMQIYADVCNRQISVAGSQETCAKGAAILAAAAAGIGALDDLRKTMVGPPSSVFHPDLAAHAVYARLFDIYARLHDAFGTSNKPLGLFDVMKMLNSIRREVQHG